jgi:hypothetical protein
LIGEEILDEYDDLQKNEQRATQRNRFPLHHVPSRKVIERSPTYAVSASEGKPINLEAGETAVFHKFGSVDRFSAADQWRSIQHVISISEVPVES